MLINNISLKGIMEKTRNSKGKNNTEQNIASLVCNTNPFDIAKLVELIQLGNSGYDYEKAVEILENYLKASEENTLLSAYFDIVETYDKLLGLLALSGYNSVDDLRAELKAKVNKLRQEMNKE